MQNLNGKDQFCQHNGSSAVDDDAALVDNHFIYLNPSIGRLFPSRNTTQLVPWPKMKKPLRALLLKAYWGKERSIGDSHSDLKPLWKGRGLWKVNCRYVISEEQSDANAASISQQGRWALLTQGLLVCMPTDTNRLLRCIRLFACAAREKGDSLHRISLKMGSRGSGE